MLKVFAVDTQGADRHEVARTLLRWKYEEIWQREMPEISVEKRGKPYFVGGPGHFNISYSKNLCCCALCDDPVGLDIERMRRVKAEAVSRILSREEWLQYASSRNPMETFLRFWTLKEAYCKFTGLGLAGTPFQDTCFDLTPEQPVLKMQENLHFWSKRVDCRGTDVILSLCAGMFHRPEFYFEEL